MKKSLFLKFSKVYEYTPDRATLQLVNEMQRCFVIADPISAKHPSVLKYGIIFGLGLQRAIQRGEIKVERPQA